MSAGYGPFRGKKERKLTEQQKQLIEMIDSGEFGTDLNAAARAVGYVIPSAAIKSVRAEIAELTEGKILALSLKSVGALENQLDSGSDPIIQANEKLKAAQIILERVVPKTDIVEHTGEAVGSIFILPEKKPLDTNDQ